MKLHVRVKNGKLIYPWWFNPSLRLRSWYWQTTLWLIDRLPWFLRKRLFNWIFDLGWTDFLQSERSLPDHSTPPMTPICIKW